MTRIHQNQSAPTLFVLILAAFGPYIIPGTIRIEHVVLYFSFLLAVVYLSLGAPSCLCERPIRRVYFGLISIFLWLSIVTTLGPHYQSPRTFFAAVDNTLQPVAIITIVSVIIVHKTQSDLAQLAIRLIGFYLILLMLNSVVALCTVVAQFTGYRDIIVTILSPFWGKSDATVLTVAEKSLGNFRFSGIFNQPFEAGLHHSYGLLLGVLKVRLQGRSLVAKDCRLMFLVSIGGLLSLSKVFLFGGIPLVIFFLMWERQLARLLWDRTSLVIVVFIVVGFLLLLRFWDGFSRLVTLLGFFRSANFVALVTGGRFGSDESVVTSIATEVMESSPIVGLGYGAFSLYDSAYIEYFASGGAIALFMYLAILGRLLQVGISNRSTVVGRFLITLLVLVGLAGLGAPVITMNRFSITFWVLVTVLLSLVSGRRNSGLSPESDNVRICSSPVLTE